MSGPVLQMDDYRPQVVINCDNGDRYTYFESDLERVAQGKLPVDHIHPEALRCIVAQWLCFTDLIDEFADDKDDD